MATSPARRGAIAVAMLWAIGIVLTACSGYSHGLVPHNIDREALPYEWGGVLFIAAVISIESRLLFWLLFKIGSLSPSWRTLVALGVFSALFAFGVLTTATDYPGFAYVNTFWTMLVVLALTARLLVQLAAARIAGLRARRARA